MPGRSIPTIVIALLFAAGCVSTPDAARPDGGSWRNDLSIPYHGVTVDRDELVPMRDGAWLAADVYRPRGGEARPAILLRTPYGKTAGADVARRYARHGYAFIVQEVRGTSAGADGAWRPFESEIEDGSDTIDWVAAQPWCSGLVGMYGASYAGWTQMAAAASGNPHLRAIAPCVSMPDPDENLPYVGGVFQMWTVLWLSYAETRQAGLSPVAWQTRDFNAIARTLPLSDLDSAAGIKTPVLDEWLAHPPGDQAYWTPRSLRERAGAMNVAALHLTGWYDDSLVGALRHYERLRDGAVTTWARDHQYLLVGPWRHEYNRERAIGDVDFGNDAVLDLDAILLRFYDCFLKGRDNGFDREPRVLLFTLGANEWQRYDDWPDPRAVPWRLHLAADGRLADERGSSGFDEFRYDPQDPRPTLRDLNDPRERFMTADHARLPPRADVLDYTSPPLDAPREITGPVRVVIRVSSDAPDTALTAELLRMTPEGRLERLAGGIRTLRDAAGTGGDEITRVEIDCWGASVRLEAGDRLRLRVSSSDFPMYARHMNTLEPMASATVGVVARGRVFREGSWVEVMEVGPDRGPAAREPVGFGACIVLRPKAIGHWPLPSPSRPPHQPPLP